MARTMLTKRGSGDTPHTLLAEAEKKNESGGKKRKGYRNRKEKGKDNDADKEAIDDGIEIEENEEYDDDGEKKELDNSKKHNEDTGDSNNKSGDGGNVAGKDLDDEDNNNNEGQDDGNRNDADNVIEDDHEMNGERKSKDIVPVRESPQEVQPCTFKMGSTLVSLTRGATEIRQTMRK